MKNNLRQQYLEAIGIQNWCLNSALEPASLESELAELQLSEELQPNEEPQLIEEPQRNKEPQLIEELQLNKEPPLYKETQTDEQSQLINTTEQQGEFSQIQQTTEAESDALYINDDEALSLQKNTADSLAENQKRLEIRTEKNTDDESQLSQTIKACTLCPSRKTRLNALSGQGNSNASVFIITGAPNAEEDQQGKYLVPQADMLLQSMLHCIELETKYYLTGLIKCYAQTDFRYSEQDLSQCMPYLYTQIEQIKPAVLLVFGAPEAQALLDSSLSFNELRGKVHQLRINDKDYCVIISYHPAYLLRNPQYKKEALNDLIMLKNQLNVC